MKAVERQAARLDERRAADNQCVRLFGYELEVAAGVYRTGVDTQLFVESIDISTSQDFLEIGCGCGAISIALSPRARSGLACDINIEAVKNTECNLQRLQVRNVKVIYSNVFSHVKETFDVLIFNCPYTNHPVRDSLERMFWDPADESKKMFFREAPGYLRPGGIVYFGWADFEGLESGLPNRLALEAGFRPQQTFSRGVPEHGFSYQVLKYIRAS